jgi:hypothetical protein
VGFKAPKCTYVLDFDETTELAGLEIKLRSLTVDQLLTLTAAVQASDQADTEADQVLALGPVLDVMAAGLIAWNVEDDDDQPIPPSRKALGGFGVAHLTWIAREWMAAAAGVPDPLAGPSPATPDPPPDLVAGLPMDPLLPSLPAPT